MLLGLQQDTVFAGRYRIVRRIAAGGMGAVYEVLHLETERRRALKVMLPHMLQSEDLRERFKREARVAARIESEFIVDVFDAGVDDATQMPFLVMELLKGEELGKRLKRVGRFPAAEVATYLQQTAMALDKTHQASIVHRDLKPENLFLTQTEDGQPRIKVLDFGIAKVLAASATGSGETQSLGTPMYMSPEQFDPDARLTGAADNYALVMMAYTLLVGASYWKLESKSSGHAIMFALAVARGPQEPASARAILEGVTLPPAFDAWFARGTAVNPLDRFATARETVAALVEALGLPSSGASLSLEQSGPVSGGPPQSGPRTAGLSQSGMRWDGVVPAGAPTPIGTSVTRALPGRNNARIAVMTLIIGVALLGGGAFVALRSPKVASSVPAASEAAAPASSSAAPPIDPAPSIAATMASFIPATSTPVATPVVAPVASLKGPARPPRPAPSKKRSYSQD
jgi:serine/threonine protein kinase